MIVAFRTGQMYQELTDGSDPCSSVSNGSTTADAARGRLRIRRPADTRPVRHLGGRQDPRTSGCGRWPGATDRQKHGQNESMVHDAAARGFDREASTYQHARPSYHPDLVARFAGPYGTGAVLEIGAGTGIFTRQIVDEGVSVVAVEPVAGMRQRLCDALPTVDVREGTAEALPLASGSFDAVVVAQAFHWFDWGPALDEIHRVLRHGGHLVTVWNVKDGVAEWFKAYMEIVDRHAGDAPRHVDMRWRAAIDSDVRYDLVDDWQMAHPQPTDRDGVVARALSTSYIAALTDDDKADVVADLRRVLANVAEPLEFPYRSELQAWRLAP